MLRIIPYVRAYCWLLAGVVVVGCGKSGGVERFGVTGNVTFDGKPVPFGKIVFEPDRRRGGAGPTGFAQIRDGQYDTSDTGKGSVAGPMSVVIEGLKSDEQFAPRLFMPYRTEVDIPEDATSFDFDVPTELKVTGR